MSKENNPSDLYGLIFCGLFMLLATIYSIWQFGWWGLVIGPIVSIVSLLVGSIFND